MLHMVIVMDQTQLEKYKALGLKISYYRRKRELTQEQLAELLGIERNHMSNIELAKVGTSLDVIFLMADTLDVPVYKFFDFRD